MKPLRLAAWVLLAIPLAAHAQGPGMSPIQVLPEDPEADALILFEAAFDGPVEWDFDDGNTSTENPAVHAYALPGIYVVTLTHDDQSYELELVVEIPAAVLWPVVANGTVENATAKAAAPAKTTPSIDPSVWTLGTVATGAGLYGIFKWLKGRHRSIRPRQGEAEESGATDIDDPPPSSEQGPTDSIQALQGALPPPAPDALAPEPIPTEPGDESKAWDPWDLGLDHPKVAASLTPKRADATVEPAKRAEPAVEPP